MAIVHATVAIVISDDITRREWICHGDTVVTPEHGWQYNAKSTERKAKCCVFVKH